MLSSTDTIEIKGCKIKPWNELAFLYLTKQLLYLPQSADSGDVQHHKIKHIVVLLQESVYPGNNPLSPIPHGFLMTFNTYYQ